MFSLVSGMDILVRDHCHIPHSHKHTLSLALFFSMILLSEGSSDFLFITTDQFGKKVLGRKKKNKAHKTGGKVPWEACVVLQSAS